MWFGIPLKRVLFCINYMCLVVLLENIVGGGGDRLTSTVFSKENYTILGLGYNIHHRNQRDWHLDIVSSPSDEAAKVWPTRCL
jgi:hypothetical protein